MTTDKYKDQIRQRAENDLLFFIKLIHPGRMLGSVHEELVEWWTRQDARSHSLLLLPRDHQKSALAGYRVAWEITKNPAIRVLYISSTSNLAQKQLKFIKDILTSPKYRMYWPMMVHPEEGKREKWTEGEISVDHPKRKAEFIRDPTIFTAGLTTSIVGLHCDLSVLDDVVVDDNAATEEGRRKVRQQVSYLASIAGTDSRQFVVGTRYHPKDLYQDMMDMTYQLYDEQGSPTELAFLYETFQRQVESIGDGTGEFLWPRSKREDGKWYGFNAEILSKKKAQYSDFSSFRAQYYNDPNDPSTNKIKSENFQYYDKGLLYEGNNSWYFKDTRLNVFAAVDFAFSQNSKADFTSIVVVGVDSKNNYYVLDIDRFKTDKISEYFAHILKLHTKWKFRKLRAETTVAQAVIVRDLKENYIKPNGLVLAIEGFRPTRGKEERMDAILEPRYSNNQIFHYRGGNCSLLEEELVQSRPPHDDIKDSLASCIEACVPPSASSSVGRRTPFKSSTSFSDTSRNRFGG